MGKVILISLFLAGVFAAWGLWIADVWWVKGWAGLAWLSGFNWSAFPICLLIVIMSSYLVAKHIRVSERIIFVGFGCLITIAAFAMTRWAAFELFAGSISVRPGLEAIVVLVIAGLIVSVGLTVSANRWLAPLHYWTGILVAVGLFLVLPLSFGTIKIFPAFNGSTDQIHAVKMGYPVLWTAVLIPIALRLGRKAQPASS